MSIKVLIADDHPLVRAGLRSTIERVNAGIEVAAEAANGRDVLKLARSSLIDVFILDISMPGLNGLETARRLMRMNPKHKIVMLSIHDSRAFVEKAIRNGARGYLLKESAVEDVVRAIRDVHRGKFYLSPSITKFVIDGFLSRKLPSPNADPALKLSTRELEILQLIAEGLTAKDIASQLHLSLNTVHVHRKNIMKKLDLHSQAELVRFALKEGISGL